MNKRLVNGDWNYQKFEVLHFYRSQNFEIYERNITSLFRISIENLKNREFESLRPRIWREIAEKKRELEKAASVEPRVCEGLV